MTSESNQYGFAYPTGLWARLLRLPVLPYRLGLGSVVGFNRIMVLTTRGHKSGLPRHTAIEYRRHGRKTYVVSMWGERPHWFQNLRVYPDVTLQQGARTLAARAAIVDNPGESLRVLHLFRRVAPAVYDALIARVANTVAVDAASLPDITPHFTIVRFDELPDQPPPLAPVPSDLAWMLPAGALIGFAALALVLFTRTRRHD